MSKKRFWDFIGGVLCGVSIVCLTLFLVWGGEHTALLAVGLLGNSLAIMLRSITDRKKIDAKEDRSEEGDK